MNARSVWEIRLGVLATAEQAADLQSRIQALLCEDPDHAPPCPIPWSIAVVELDDSDETYEELRIQAAFEDDM